MIGRMTKNTAILTRPRVAFLLVLAIAISILFFWVIESFVLAVFLSAVLSGMLQPIYRRILTWTGGRQTVASALTVVLTFVAGIVPLLLLLGLISAQAVQIRLCLKTALCVKLKCRHIGRVISNRHGGQLHGSFI